MRSNRMTLARTWRAALFCMVMVTFGPGGPANAVEEILSFDAAIAVRSDGILDVTETIRVRAEGDQIKRGIFRDFPLTFTDDKGRSRRVDFRLLGVSRNGASEPYHTTSNSRGLRIYAGEESVLLAPGIYTYEIHYETTRQIRFFPDHAELFWNVTGNEWAFPILHAVASVALPDGRVPARWTAYTGGHGARGDDFAGQIQSDNRLNVSTIGTLNPGEGLSIVVELPLGLVAQPEGAQALHYWYLDNRRFILGGLGFLGVLVFYLSAWIAVGRDPAKGTIIPLFHPPAGISPALAGYIRNWGWRGDWRGFTAAALSLAVKGLLVFDDSKDTIVLARTDMSRDRAETDLPPGERAILKWVGSRGGLITIDSTNGKSIGKALTDFKAKIEAENRNRFFKRNLGYFVVGVLMTAVSLVLVLAFGDLSDGEIGLLVAVVFVGVFFGIFLVPIIRVIAGARRSVRLILAAAINVAALAAILAIFFAIGLSAYQALPDNFGDTFLSILLTNGFPFALVGGFALMNGLFYYLLRAPTAAGRKVMDEIEGLELYIRTAETGRLNAAGAPDLTTDQFERLLPYAIALEAEKPWSEAFAAAFARAHPGEAVETAYAPRWHGGHGWSGRDFATSLSSAVASAAGSFASAVPAPSSSSSGFSSGGGSGGGGGGGGGGGW